MANGNVNTLQSLRGDATGRPAPRILPTRRRLETRFPQLAFTIQTGGRPYFEVLLTTDPGLYAPARAGERTAATFYPVRADERRLQPALGGSAVYMVPQSVLHAFAHATPRPNAIFYTVVAYADADGGEPAFALPPDELARHAPSVDLAADFSVETLAAGLGIPLGMLRRMDDSRPLAAPALVREDDLAEGEDGTSALQLAVAEAHDGTRPHDNGIGNWQGESDIRGLGFEDEFDDSHDFDDEPADQEPYTAAQESGFSAQMREPAALQDDEEPADEYDDASDALAYDDGYGALPGVAVGQSHHGANNGRHYDGAAGRAGKAPLALGHADDEAHNSYLAKEDSAGGWYGDEADGFAYEEAFAADEAEDEFEPELPYQPLSAGFGHGEPAAPAPLTIDVQRAIIERIGRFESGSDGYSAMNRDGEYRGVFGQNHSAYNRYHIGLSFGLIQFTQDSGALGQLLTMMRDRDQARFDAIFGPQAGELLQVTNAAGPSSSEVQGGRSARVQPVGGTDLWEEPWVSRFAAAGRHGPFQAAQNELAARLYVAPMLPFASWLGLNSDRALAMVVDRAVQMGVGGARRWIASAVGPIQTAAQRQQALAALGQRDLRSFQGATRGLTADGTWGPLTHAALVAGLRGLGTRSPIEIPSREQMMDGLVRRSASEPWNHRVRTLRQSSEFSDTVYEF